MPEYIISRSSKRKTWLEFKVSGKLIRKLCVCVDAISPASDLSLTECGSKRKRIKWRTHHRLGLQIARLNRQSLLHSRLLMVTQKNPTTLSRARLLFQRCHFSMILGYEITSSVVFYLLYSNPVGLVSVVAVLI